MSDDDLKIEYFPNTKKQQWYCLLVVYLLCIKSKKKNIKKKKEKKAFPQLECKSVSSEVLMTAARRSISLDLAYDWKHKLINYE